MTHMRWTPGRVEEVDRAARLVRVSYPGVTAEHGAQEFPVAQVCFATGEAAADTEVRIPVGSLVWLDFIGGDWASAIIIGFRAAETGNTQGARRIRMDAIELVADAGDMKLSAEAGVVTVHATRVRVVGGPLEVAADAQFSGLVTVAGGLRVTAGEMTHRGVEVGVSHVHTSGSPGSPTSAVVG